MAPAGRRWLVRLGVLATVAAALAPALPAAAQESQTVKLSAAFPNMTVAPGTDARSMNIMVWANVKEATELHHFRFAIDSAGLNGIATVGPSFDYCTTTGTVKTCDSFADPIVESSASGVAIIYVRPTDGAKVGQHGTVKLTVSADDAVEASITSTITIGEAVDLVSTGDVTVEGQIGGTVAAPLGVRNAGQVGIRGVDLLIGEDYAAKLADRYTNCEYDGRGAICHFDTTLEPGVEYALSKPLSFVIGKDAWAPGEMEVGGLWLTPDDVDAYFQGVPQPKSTRGTAGQLTLVSRQSPARAKALSQTDPQSQDNYGSITIKVTGDNRADFAAIGATARGEVGTVVTVDVGVKNLGPASANFRSGNSVQTVQIDVPDGTTAVSVSKRCIPHEAGNPVYERTGQPGAKQYWCGTDWRFPVGETSSWTFGLRIDKKIDGATGMVTININSASPENPNHDTNAANDTANIVINPVGGAAGEGAFLPVTGGRIGILAGTAVAMLVAGVVVFMFGRRRRTRFVAES